MKKLIVLFFCSVIIFSCKKEKPVVTPQEPGPTGSMNISFRNMVGTDSLVLNTQNYVNLNGDTFSVDVYNYYISNLKLIRTNNTAKAISESYYLIKANDPSSWNVVLAKIPQGEYKAIEFLIGVDSTRNVSGAQTGALDPAHNMFWSWSSGYIMTKLEGSSPQAPSGSFGYHVSGFYGVNSVLKNVHLDFPINAQVGDGTTSTLTIKNDLQEWFQNPSLIKLGVLYSVHAAGTSAKSLADNYADMFSVISLTN